MNNNNAQYGVPPLAASHLRVQTIPTFPLSSPIKEEIYTPFESPGSSQLAAPDKDNPFTSPEDYFTHGKTCSETDNATQFESQTEDKQKLLGETAQAPRPSRWDSIRRGRTIMKRNPKEAATNKKTRPGLNLVTNFSNDTPKYRRDAVSKRRQSAGRGFIDLNDLRLLSKGTTETARPVQANRLLAERRLSSAKGYEELKDNNVGEPSNGPQASHYVRKMKKSPLDALRAASPSKMQDLSPSDRPIMIGLSVPYNDAGGHGKSKKHGDDSSTPIKNNIGSPNSQKSPNNTTPITPTIIITPAREDNPWDSFSTGSPEARRARPASSVYSQATPRVKDGRPPSVIPPVPAIPASHSFTKTGAGDVFVVDQVPTTPARRNRALSAGTLFEDDSPVCTRTGGRPRSMSDESRLQAGIANRYSIDTIATRPRSQGWWNLLLSPLLSRSNTMASKMSFRSPQDETPPALPPVPFAVSQSLQVDSNRRYGEKHVEEEVSFFSPDTPYSAEEKESLWASAAGTVGKPQVACEGSASEWDDVDADDCSQLSSRQSRDKTSHTSTVSAQTIPFMISSPTSAGYTQEHFQQSVHDYFTNKQSPPPIPSTSPHTHTQAVFSRKYIAAFPPVPGENVQVENQNPNNPFFQRFVDSVRSGAESRERSNSDSTVIEDEPDISPNVRQATATPLLRAAAIGPFQAGPTAPLPPIPRRESPLQKPSNSSPTMSVGNSSTQPPPYSPPKKITGSRRYRAILPSDLHPQPQSPGPLSPETQTSQMASRGGGILLGSIQQPQPPAATYSARNDPIQRGVLPPRLPNNPVHLSDVQRPVDIRANNESRRQRLEREDRVARKVGGLWRGRGCLSNRGCFGRSGREGRKRRRWYVCIAAILIAIVIVSVVLAVTLTRKSEDTPESRWLNLTGYPPMPTGVSTIAGPNAAVANSGCIRPSTMWSCALPKENHDANKPFDPDQPNFRIQINFRNGTFAHSTVPSNQAAQKRSVSTFLGKSSASPKALDSRQSLRKRNGGFSPIPAPPSIEEQAFLGNTTDGVTAPFAGEDTPFFATFLSPEPIKISTRQRRADTPPPQAEATDGDDLRDAIPNPAHSPDGTAAPASLLPLPIAQPVRLYDRGLPTEHYGFYTYYDRSIFLKADRPLNNDSILSVIPDDQNGGSTRSAARVRCTWTQTRFLVQIWTQPGRNGMGLIPSPTSSSSASPPESSTATLHPSGTNFTRPGSFPYPITVVLDRHGGDPKAKMVYCYGLNLEQRYIVSSKQLQVEDRGFGGQLVKPGTLLGGGSGSSSSGGFDGGNGGCRCEWRNWLAVG
ncbi:hypothetical protein GX51_02684 [Blastomyces parvus]|uniref:Glycoprotease family protein n=1 Tax=Blastomyces parvus TaxID=2060905 RepID=A0A2B7XAU8_9EURO|nr:hypothetical protein GX51_02684 [Blastomyces parvus]